MLSRYNIRASQDEIKNDKPLTKEQMRDVLTAVQKYRVRYRKALQNEDVLIFLDFMSLTALTVQLSGKFFVETCYKHKMERRAFLTKGELGHYSISVKTY